MIRESILELAAAAPPDLRPILISACLESALLRSFHDSSAFSCLCMTGQSASRYGSGSAGLCSNHPANWGELSFRLIDKKGYYPERWLFKAQRYLRYMGIDSRIGFTRKATTHAGWIRAQGLVDATGLADLAGMADLKTPAAAPQGVTFVIDIQGGLTAGPSPGRVILVEGWGECFSLRLED